MSLKNYITTKYKCKKCRKCQMYPNEDDKHIKGFKCVCCGAVNYPVKNRNPRSLSFYALYAKEICGIYANE